MFAAVDQPGVGTYLMPGSPLAFSAVDRVPPAPAPLLGQHTDEILQGVLGLTDTDIGRLHDDGVVAGPACLIPDGDHCRNRYTATATPSVTTLQRNTASGNRLTSRPPR